MLVISSPEVRHNIRKQIYYPRGPALKFRLLHYLSQVGTLCRLSKNITELDHTPGESIWYRTALIKHGRVPGGLSIRVPRYFRKVDRAFRYPSSGLEYGFSLSPSYQMSQGS